VWIPGTGELGSRIARGLDVKGRVITEVEEGILPTVLVSDAPNRPPFRTDGILAFSVRKITAAAAQFPITGIFNPTAQNQLLESIRVSGQGPFEWTLGIAPAVGLLAGGVDGGIACVSTEFVAPATVSSPTFKITPLTNHGYSLAAFPPQTFLQISGSLQATTNLIPLDIVIPPNTQLFVQSDVLAGIFACNYICRYFVTARP